MKVEDFMEVEYINRVREAVDNMLTALSIPPDFRRDRLLVEVTREVCLSRV
jgi:hypothetical protein